MYYRTYNQNPMGGMRRGILDYFRSGTALSRLIYINCGVFLAVSLAYIPFLLAGYQGVYHDILLEWLGVPADPAYLLVRPWTLVTYMFTHFGFLHLLFNLLWLYWFGNLFLNHFTERASTSSEASPGQPCLSSATTFSPTSTASPGCLRGQSEPRHP